MIENCKIKDVIFTIRNVDNNYYAIDFDVVNKTYRGFKFLNEEMTKRVALDEFTCTRLFTNIMNFFKGVE